MIGPLKSDIIDAVLSGIIDANIFYSEITNGSWISEAGVENIVQSKIAESLFSRLKAMGDERWQIHLEYPISAFRYEVGIKRRGRVPQSLDGSKRLDLVLFDEADRPRIPIEVKRLHAAAGLKADFKRIADLLKQSWTASEQRVDYGICCGFVVGSGHNPEGAEEQARKRLMVVDRLSRGLCKSLVGVKSQFCDRVADVQQYDTDGHAYWVPAAFCICLEQSLGAEGSTSGVRNLLRGA